jgi:hypothetical protein
MGVLVSYLDEWRRTAEKTIPAVILVDQEKRRVDGARPGIG